MIDAILHLSSAAALPASLTDEDGNPALSEPKTTNVAGEQMHYVRMTPAQLDEWRPHVTVLAEASYTGTGTADRVYAQVQGSGDKMAIYSSVHNLDPVARIDEDGNEYVTQPPFKFGMLAESALPVPESVTSRQGMEQLIRSGLDEQVDDAINGITDSVERKLARNWLYKAGVWERNNPQLLAIGNALGLSKQDVDSLFIQAATL